MHETWPVLWVLTLPSSTKKPWKNWVWDACLALLKALTRNLVWWSLNTTAARRTTLPLLWSVKDLTFDSGGISLKPAKGMDEMKYDMCGAAAMIASIATAAAMKLPVNIVAAVGFTENMPGSSATKPGDILEELCRQDR